MAGISQYSKDEILFVLRRIVKKIRQSQIVDEYRKRFGKALNPNQVRYIKNKYGKDPDYGSPMINYRGGNASDLEDSDHAPEEQARQENSSAEPHTQEPLSQQEHQEHQEQPEVPRHTSNKPANPGRLQNRKQDHHNHPYDARRRSNSQMTHQEQPTRSAVANSYHVMRHDQRLGNLDLNYTTSPSPTGVEGHQNHQSHHVYHGHSSYPDYSSYSDPVPRLFTQDLSTTVGQAYPYHDVLIGTPYHEGVSVVQNGQMQVPVGAYMGFDSGMIHNQWHGNSTIPMTQPYDPYMDAFASSPAFQYTDIPPRGTVPPSHHFSQLYDNRQQTVPAQINSGYGILDGSWYPSMTGREGQAIHQPVEQVKPQMQHPQIVHPSTVSNANIASMTVNINPRTDPVPSLAAAKKRPRSPREKEEHTARPAKCMKTIGTDDNHAATNVRSMPTGQTEPDTYFNELPVGMPLGEAYRVKREIDLSLGAVQPGLSPVPGDFVIPAEADAAYSKMPFSGNRLDSGTKKRRALAKAGLDVTDLPESPLEFSPTSLATIHSLGPSVDNEPDNADHEVLNTTSSNDNVITRAANEEEDTMPHFTTAVEPEPPQDGVQSPTQALDNIPSLLDDLIYWENELGELEAFDLDAEFDPFPSNG